MVVAGSALLVTRWSGCRSQGSLQRSPLPQLSLFCFWKHRWVLAPGKFLPASYQHGKTALRGNQLDPAALDKPSTETAGPSLPAKARTAENKISSSNLQLPQQLPTVPESRSSGALSARILPGSSGWAWTHNSGAWLFSGASEQCWGF